MQLSQHDLSKLTSKSNDLVSPLTCVVIASDSRKTSVIIFIDVAVNEGGGGGVCKLRSKIVYNFF